MATNEYDLIVVGAGSGGCAAAKTASEKGLRVLLLDRRKKEDIGNKLTFDTIPSYAFQAFGIPLPQGDELDFRMRKLKVFSPGMKHFFEADMDAFLCHRHLLGQRLLNDAQEAGCKLRMETEVMEPIVERDFVVGVNYRPTGGEETGCRARVVCDASGFRAVVRDRLESRVYRSEKILPQDTVVCYREVRDLKDSSTVTPDAEYPGWYCTLRDRGYFWVVPEKNGKVNVGCGIPLFPGHPDPEKLTIDFCRENSQFIGDKVYAKGTGPTPYLPMRADQPELTGNGFVVVGDSAYQVSTNSGFGVPGSLVAGKTAAEVIARAVRAGDVSREGMWEYNVSWKRGGGSMRAFADGIRLFVQNISHEDLDLLIRTEILGSKEFSNLWNDRTFEYSLFELLRKLPKGLLHPRLLGKAQAVYLLSKKLERLYRRFPESPKDFDAWMSTRRKTYGRLFRLLNVKREICETAS